jgi:DNA-binding MarR family transcriptional regulator
MTAAAPQRWGLFTNHALVMTYVCEHSDSTVRAISDAIGITERATLAMLGDLQQSGIVVRHRVGRSNTYSMDFERLAMFRRGNAGPPTPASFADALIRTLLEISGRSGRASAAPPRPIDAGAFSGEEMPWGFFTNQLRTLLAVANAEEPTANEISNAVGITERAAVAILRQLEDEGMLVRSKEGRRNSYRIEFDAVRRFPRWSSGPWPLQRALVDAAVQGLRELAAHSGSRASAPPARNSHAPAPARKAATARRRTSRGVRV